MLIQRPNLKSVLLKPMSMLPMGYFFATYGASVSMANSQAIFACKQAESLGIPKGSYLAVDWESGDGNNINRRPS